jgi:hypothetical protein
MLTSFKEAPGMVAPEGSTTVPEMLPPVAARIGTTENNRNAIPETNLSIPG